MATALGAGPLAPHAIEGGFSTVGPEITHPLKSVLIARAPSPSASGSALAVASADATDSGSGHRISRGSARASGEASGARADSAHSSMPTKPVEYRQPHLGESSSHAVRNGAALSSSADQQAGPASAPADDEAAHGQGALRKSDSSRSKANDNCNFRDVAYPPGPSSVKRDMLFRGSQFHSQELRERLAIRTILDLRKTGERACRKPMRQLRELMHPEWQLRKIRNNANADGAPRCPNCESQLNNGSSVKGCVAVHHVDFCTPQFQMTVAKHIPAKDLGRALASALKCHNPSSAMARVVGDQSKFGYGKLYTIMLERSKTMIGRAFRILARRDAYPVIVHCTHGKDRTGVLIMLVLRTCGVDFDEIIEEYMSSTETMQMWSEVGANMDPNMQSDEVLSLERDYLLEAIRYIQRKYGDVPQYLDTCGVNAELRQRVRDNLLKDPEAASSEPQGRPEESAVPEP